MITCLRRVGRTLTAVASVAVLAFFGIAWTQQPSTPAQIGEAR